MIKQISSNPKYSISDAGIFYKQTENGLVEMKPSVSGGYHMVCVPPRKGRYVHEIVLTEFVGPRPSRLHVGRHLNNIKTDNRLENLAWGTRKENCEDMILHGTSFSGERHPNTSVTNEQAIRIRSMKADGMTSREIRDETGVSIGTINNIVAFRSFAKIKS